MVLINSELERIDKKIIYLGDNSDLGLHAKSMTDTIVNNWNTFDAIDTRQARRAKRDQERLTFFTNITGFLRGLDVRNNFITTI
jgi:hypothetical protein